MFALIFSSLCVARMETQICDCVRRQKHRSTKIAAELLNGMASQPCKLCWEAWLIFTSTEPSSESTKYRDELLAWLTEEYEKAELRHTWSMTMEFLITIFAFFELGMKLAGVIYQLAYGSSA
jgi:hypothetical protein